jgi:GTP-binding protein
MAAKTSAEWLLTWGPTTCLAQEIEKLENAGINMPRHAFVGRSNVGKSSLINALLGQKLAQVSRTPGKTRLIHMYRAPELKNILVDLPGYGFAKVSKAELDSWKRMLEKYLRLDRRLQGLWILLDARHGPTPMDREAILFFETLGIPIHFVMTKSDQLKNQKERSARKKEVKEIFETAGIDPETIPWVSVKDGSGLPELIRQLKSEGNG